MLAPCGGIIADEHMLFSLPNIVDGDYEGEHWLASFAVYALDMATASARF